MLASGAIKGGLGILELVSLEALAAAGSITVLSVGSALLAAGGIAIAPVLLVTGAYSLVASDKESRELLGAANRMNDAVKAVTRPVDWLEDRMTDYLPEGFTFPSATIFIDKDESVSEIFQEMAKDVVKDAFQDLSDGMLEPSESESGTRSRDDPASTDSSTRIEGPMCSPDDPSDGDEGSNDDDSGPSVEMSLG